MSGSSKAHSRNRQVRTDKLEKKERKEERERGREGGRKKGRKGRVMQSLADLVISASGGIEGTKDLNYRERKRKALLF